MFRMQQLFLVALAVCVSANHAIAETTIIAEAVQGNPALKSIDTLSFAPGGVLLVGDGASSRIVAIETRTAKQEPFSGTIREFGKQIASRLGTKAGGIEILDFAVNPETRAVFVAVRKQDDRKHVIVMVDDSKQLQEFQLDEVRYASTMLTATDAKITKVTDVAWADGQIVAAGRSNESFASKIFSIPTPLKHEATTGSFSAETYHVSHRRWETKAPMSVLIPFKENDQTFVVGAFSCTPVVKYPIDSLQPGAKVKGTSVLELGSGNRPIDMFIYQKDGKPFVLANTFRFHHERRPFGPSPYWTVKFEQGILSATDEVDEQALRRLKGTKPTTDRVQMIESFHGVMQMDKLDDTRAVVLRQTKNGVDLETLLLP